MGYMLSYTCTSGREVPIVDLWTPIECVVCCEPSCDVHCMLKLSHECHACCLIPNPSQKIHKSHAALHSRLITAILFFTKMCTLLVSLVSSTCLLPTTFTNVHKSCFYMSLAHNIHKSSQILFPHVSCPEHSQIFTNLISTCLLPRTFTNLHKSSQILFPHVYCPEYFT